MNRIVKNSKKLIAFLILSVMILSASTPVAFAQGIPVTDIANHWANQEITSWLDQGFIKGYPDGTFKPDSYITRAEFISLVNRLFAFSEKAAVPFTDVEENSWFYADFAKAAKAGYLSGYTAGTIDPDGFITRQEVAAIAAKLKALPDDAAAADGLADAAAIPAMYKGSIGAVVKAKIMTGYPDGKFEPVKNITRAESVIVLKNLVNFKADAVKIDAVNDLSVSVGFTATVALKMQPADAIVSVQNSDDKVVQATLAGSYIQLKGLAIGTSTITLTGKKGGLQDGVVTFKVTVNTATTSTSSGGGGSSHSHSSGSSGNNTPATPQPDENAITAAQAIAGSTTTVTGKYASGVSKVEVCYGSTTLAAATANGSFSCSITPGLAIGTDITVKAYNGTTVVDTDAIQVAEDDSMLTEVQAVGTKATQVSGSYANGVTRVELIYGNTTVDTKMENGTFSWNIAPGLASGTTVTINAYAGTVIVDVDKTQVNGAALAPYISNLKAVGTKATQVSGNYANGVTRVELIYGNTTVDTKMENGTFSWNIAPGLASGTTVTINAYVGTQRVATEQTTVGGSTPTQAPYISNLKAVGTKATQVSGNYANGVTRVELIYGNTTVDTKMENGTFSWNIAPGLASGTTVTINAYVGTQRVATEQTTVGGSTPVEEHFITNATAIPYGSFMIYVTGYCSSEITAVDVLYSSYTKPAAVDNGQFSYEVVPPDGQTITTVTLKAYAGSELKETLSVNVQ